MAEQLYIYNEAALRDIIIAENMSGVYATSAVFKATPEKVYPDKDVIDYMKNCHYAVGYDELQKHLWFIPLDTIKHVLVSTPSLAQVDWETYMYAPNFPASAEELRSLVGYMKKRINEKGFLVSKDIAEIIVEKCPAIAINTEGYKDWAYRNVLKYILRDYFEFGNSVVSEKGKKLEMWQLYRSFCRDHEMLSFEELKQFSNDIGVQIYWDDVFTEMVRVNSRELVRRDKVHFDVEATDRILDEVCLGDYVPLKQIGLFLHFPTIEYPWNSYLLESYLAYEYIYYFSLVNHTKGLEHILDKLVEKYSKIDYKNLEAKGYYDLAVFEFNNTCIKYLLYLPNGKGNLDFVLERAAALFSDAYNSIKEMSNKNADIQRMNEILYKHEEYYMKKEQISKLGGTEYGDLYKIRQMAYDYYQFYKKNHLMLEWIPNVTKYVTPYVNAIFCTYYPDRFQGDYFGAFPRTNVVPYPLTLLDIDMIVKHISVKELKSIIWKYKVEYIFIDTNVDVAELFENFCVSMKKYFVIKRIDQLESFSLLLSLCRLNLEQNREITTAFLRLMTPNKSENINAVTNCIKALSVYAASHFDSGIPEYYNLLELLINKDVFSDAMFKSKKEFVELIARLSSPNDKLYDKIWTEYNKLAVGEDKALWAYTFRKILTSINCEKWKSVMQDNLEYLQEGEIFQCLLEKELEFDATIKKHYMNIMSQRMIPGITTFPNHRENAIEYVVLSVILGIVTVEDISFMKDYVQESDYLEFIFSPNSFDYSKIKVSDAIWCDFIQNEIFRDLILKHKDMFWNKEEIKRIDLGFGSSFENRIVYKYLYD